MKPVTTGTPEEWLTARSALLEKEKDMTRARDALSAARRKLPWVPVEKDYAFETAEGKKSLGELFDGRSQLLVYHFMFGPDWEVGCKSCSLVAEGFDGALPHLAARDVTLIAASRAPLDRLLAFRARLGWSFPWVSSLGSDFNMDLAVSFPPEARDGDSITYNYQTQNIPAEELPGISAFARTSDGAVYHTYSAYSRGLDDLIGTYRFLDIAPKGRDETEFAMPMDWVRFRDSYAT